MRSGGIAGHHAGGKGLSLVIAATDDEWGGDIVLAEVAERRDVGGVELDGASEAGLDLAGEGESGDGAGVACLHAVGASEPELVVTALEIVGRRGDGEFALTDGFVGLVLRVVDAAEDLMCGRVGWIGGQGCPQEGCGLVDAAFQQRAVGRGVGSAQGRGVGLGAGLRGERKREGAEQQRGS